MKNKEKEKREVEVNGVRKVHHYLHNMASGATDAVREGDSLIFSLPNPNWQERNVASEAEYRLQIDPRDQRTLVVFDGHVPWGGFSKGTSVVLRIPDFMILRTRINYIRKNKPGENGLDVNLRFDLNYAMLPINRYFLLVPKVRICVRRYDNKSFRPIYTSIEINDKEILQPKGITWCTSSY